MKIKVDDLTAPAIAALLREHLDDMHRISPRESAHALDIAGLKIPEITCWSAWDRSELLGCGALRELDPTHGEIKSMRTARAHRRKGVAARILDTLVAEAIQRGYTHLSLETGTQPEFESARQLYRRFGFKPTGPFADYRLDPNSHFMTRCL